MSRKKKSNFGFFSATSRIFWKVAVYIRLSKEDGHEVSNSVKNQETRLMQHLVTFDEEYELVGKYIDDGFTGTDTNRESFQLLIQHIKAHKVNCVIVKDLSRLSRNISDASYYIEHLFVEHNVRFISLELPAIDSYKYPEQMNSIIVPIQSVINDDFCRQTSIKVRGVLRAKRNEGQYLGAFGPHGYMRDPDNKYKLIIDEEAAEVIRDIFKMYVMEGMSKEAITRRLNALGIPNPAAYKRLKGLNYKNPFISENSIYWSARTITVILENEMYIGNMVQGRERIKSYKVHTRVRLPKEEWLIVENTHEAIISKEMFQNAQILLKKNTKTSSGTNHVYLLSGFCRCPDCGKALSRIGSNKRNGNVYYVCSTYRNNSRDACTKHSIRIDVLEKIVTEAVKKQIDMVVSLDEIIDEINGKQHGKAGSSRLENLKALKEKELANITRIKDGLYADWKNGFISQEDFIRMKVSYENQITSIRFHIQNLMEEQSLVLSGVASENQFLQTFLRHKNITELNRNILTDLIDVVYVHDDGQVEIIFSHADQYVKVLDRIEA